MRGSGPARPRLRRHVRRATGIVAAAAMLATVSMSAQAHDVSCARTDVTGGEWRQFGNQLTGDRFQDRELYINQVQAALLEPAWTFDANLWTRSHDNEITSYPIVADGCVYVGTNSGWQTPGWILAINADTGELVWRTQVDRGVYATLAVENGLVYAFVSKVKVQADTSVGGPYVVALDQRTGAVVWKTTVDYQIGADAVASPVVYDGVVWVGISGTAAEVSEGDRGLFQGNSVLLEADDLDGDGNKGEVIARAHSIPTHEWKDGYAGGAQWATIAIDPTTSYGYVGTGNPFDYDKEHANTNAVLKLDMARARNADGSPVMGVWPPTNPAFGKVVGSYKGQVEEYFPELSGTVPCNEVEDIGGAYAAGIECVRLDLDFGAQGNIFTDSAGRRVLGIGQKSGVYHYIDTTTMTRVREVLLGVPSAVGGIVGSTAFDGRNIYGPHTLGGYLWSIEAHTGAHRWVAPVADGVHWGNPTTVANGVIYTVDLKGFLDAYDAASGTPLLHRPLGLGADTREDPTLTWGGTTIARNTVYATVGVGLTSLEMDQASMPNGFVIAFRPRRLTP